MTDHLTRAEEVFERESAHKKSISSTFEELESLRDQKGLSTAVKSEALLVSLSEPSRLLKWAETIEKASAGIDVDLIKLGQRIKACDVDIDKEGDRRVEAEKLRIGLLEKLDLNRHTIEKREVDVAVVKKNLENAKSQHHDLITSKVELNLQRREAESSTRHRVDQLALVKKGYEMLKRQLKKKVNIANGVKLVLIPLSSQVYDQEVMLKTYASDLDDKRNQITAMKADVNFNMMQFLQMDGIEKEKRIVSTFPLLFSCRESVLSLASPPSFLLPHCNFVTHSITKSPQAGNIIISISFQSLSPDTGTQPVCLGGRGSGGRCPANASRG